MKPNKDGWYVFNDATLKSIFRLPGLKFSFYRWHCNCGEVFYTLRGVEFTCKCGIQYENMR